MQQRILHGFTLLELSIVLVIIGLVLSGILAGRDMIAASEVRAEISQIGAFQTSTRIFRGKYGALPGDMEPVKADRFGFIHLDGTIGYGDGNGVLEGASAASGGGGFNFWYGETQLFWNHLSAAGLISGDFALDDGNGNSGTLLPAKLGKNKYVFVWSGGYGLDAGNSQGGSGGSTDPMSTNPSNYVNYFGVAAFGDLMYPTDNIKPGLTPAQAYGIDVKLDDGLPQSGRITAMYPFAGYMNVMWATGEDDADGVHLSAPIDGTVATPANGSTCYDNGNHPNTSQRYSMATPYIASCAIAIQFQ